MQGRLPYPSLPSPGCPRLPQGCSWADNSRPYPFRVSGISSRSSWLNPPPGSSLQQTPPHPWCPGQHHAGHRAEGRRQPHLPGCTTLPSCLIKVFAPADTLRDLVLRQNANRPSAYPAPTPLFLFFWNRYVWVSGAASLLERVQELLNRTSTLVLLLLRPVILLFPDPDLLHPHPGVCVEGGRRGTEGVDWDGAQGSLLEIAYQHIS